MHTYSVAEMGTEAGTSYRGPTKLHMFLSFSVVSIMTAPIYPFRPSPSPSATNNEPFRFTEDFYLGRPCLGRGAENPFLLEPEPALGGPADIIPSYQWFAARVGTVRLAPKFKTRSRKTCCLYVQWRPIMEHVLYLCCSALAMTAVLES
jgi:hypothetical protein